MSEPSLEQIQADPIAAIEGAANRMRGYVDATLSSGDRDHPLREGLATIRIALGVLEGQRERQEAAE